MIKSTLTSKRLHLRLIALSDLAFIHDLLSQPETDEYNALGTPKSIDETKKWITPWVLENEIAPVKNHTWIIEGGDTKAPIGLFGLKLSANKYRRGEVWYKIHPTHWKKGYATEALKCVIDYGFDTCDLHRVQAGCAVDNIGSIRVLEKVGMIKEGRGRKLLPLKSGWSDNFEYSILESDERKSI
ncbi:MAG: GNAT family N-acetyltransferase [Fluviicola sp.]|nr:MAG: GNAT family N-acetyltransferase [Fluviicola sp.]